MKLDAADLDRYLTTPPDDIDPTGKCAFCTDPIYPGQWTYRSELIDGEFCTEQHRRQGELAALRERCMTEADLDKQCGYKLCPDPEAPILIALENGEKLLVRGAWELDGMLHLDAREPDAFEATLIEAKPWRDV